MLVSKEEILHIAKLADIKIEENEIDEYAKNLEDILNFVEVLNNVDTENVEESIGTVNNSNVFRKNLSGSFREKLTRRSFKMSKTLLFYHNRS